MPKKCHVIFERSQTNFFSDTKIHGGSKWVNLRNGNIEHNESVDINEVEIDKNDVDEERSRRRRHRRSADASMTSPLLMTPLIFDEVSHILLRHIYFMTLHIFYDVTYI